ncbi:MAG TPA: DNA methyltransferase [Gemmatimonadaceae bacterium]|nr:DNA methyltransferase [Gemmatimonadaceae bacterium]
MLTIRAAASLLASANSTADIARVLTAIGLPATPEPLDASQRRTLGLAGIATDAHLVGAQGNARALIISVTDGPSLHDVLPRLAARLHSVAPHVFWLVAASDPRDATFALAAWAGDRRSPGVHSLIVDRAHVADSDAETVCALAAAPHTNDLMLHLGWVEVLGRDALSRRFYAELRECVAAMAQSASGRAPGEERDALALLCTSRLLFLCFLEAKGWLDGRRGFLLELFDHRMLHGGGFHARTLQPLFFGTLNTPRRHRAAAARAFGRIPFLNGGLFAPTALERRHRDLRFSDEAIGALIGGLLSRYRFTAREEAATWSDAAVDPEMLGRAFESLMAAHDRRSSGAFFTPQTLVIRVTDLALVHVVQSLGIPRADADILLESGELPRGDPARLRARLFEATLLDPACGSGAFLVYALQRLARLHLALGDGRPPSDVRRDVLTRCLFGVDRNPMAAWLCELRLWLAVVIESDIEDPMQVPPLPNLDRNVRVGDALSGPDFGAHFLGTRSERLTTLRARYARATGPRKATLARALDRDERTRALAALDRAIAGAQHARREHLAARRAPDLFGQRSAETAADRAELAALRSRLAALRRERRRLADGGALPFSFPVHFADVAAHGGFDAVVGNPPWVRIHRIPAAERPALRRNYYVYRNARWAAGAEAARAGAGFSAQVDLAALFVERSVDLLRPGGAAALLAPAKLWRSLAGGGLRQFISERTELAAIEDRSDAPPSFDAAVYPSIIGLIRRHRDPTVLVTRGCTSVAVQRASTLATWKSPAANLPLDQTPGSPWLLIPPPVRAAFDRLSAAGLPLGESPVGVPMLGVKCGCNDAFVVELVDLRGGVACVRAAGGRTGEVEGALLRPVIRGETTRAWSPAATTERIIWPYDARGRLIDPLPPRARKWFAHYKHRLMQRSDGRASSRWWSLFRLDGAARESCRVVWADFGRRPRALVLDAGNRTVPLNTCYVARCANATDALTLAAILNSPIAAAWLHVVAEPARGGFHRYLGWTMARLPMPADWARARGILAPMVTRRVKSGSLAATPSSAWMDPVLDAYNLRRADLADLLTWASARHPGSPGSTEDSQDA